MEPVILSYNAAAHGLDEVARHVVADHLPARLAAWKQASQARELVYVATCQRVMWLVWGGKPEDLGELEAQRLEGEAAWRHLLDVATGLESANLGDREVPGQMRDALEVARQTGAADGEALAVFEDVIREAQRLRSRVGLADGTVSVATAALRHLSEALEPGTKVAVVGVGPMSQYLAERLPERGFPVTVVNRTEAKARGLAEPLGLPVEPLEDLRRDPNGFGAIVTATSAPEPIFTFEAWRGLPKRAHLRLLDLALPPDSEPALERIPWVQRVDLPVFLEATATTKAQRAEAAAKAEPHLLAAVARLRKRAEERAHKRDRELASTRLEEAWELLVQEALGELDETQRESMAQFLQRGRTLAYRALAQSQLPPEVLALLTRGAPKAPEAGPKAPGTDPNPHPESEAS
ncbi:MAG: NAD(P)-binding domain-containing protein [Holophagaceae bacterium]